MTDRQDQAQLTIGLDGDDTLWHNEEIFQNSHTWYTELLAAHGIGDDAARVHDRLLEIETANVAHFGFGIKGYVLSLVETAMDLAEGPVDPSLATAIVERARQMLAEPTELLDGVEETVRELSSNYRLLLITKGDLADQETKIGRSGLADYFDDVHVVSHKTSDTYRGVLERHGVQPTRFVMIGNSVPSDILPALEIGGAAVHIPYHVTWALETTDHQHPAEDPAHHGRCMKLERISELPAALKTLNA